MCFESLGRGATNKKKKMFYTQGRMQRYLINIQQYMNERGKNTNNLISCNVWRTNNCLGFYLYMCHMTLHRSEQLSSTSTM